MPRIDPLQLLNCLQVLLTRNGGIQSKDEVQRLANLMTKFSKKLVSKCIYILILKNTDTHLLDLFMKSGGWNLVMVWLQEAMSSVNIPLTIELLELLTMTPVNVERLKTNIIPKLVKNLTRKSDPEVVQLSTKLVNNWLEIVKDQAGQLQAEAASTEAAAQVQVSTAAEEKHVNQDVKEVSDNVEMESREESEGSEKKSEGDDKKRRRSSKSSRDKDRERRDKKRSKSKSKSGSSNSSSSSSRDKGKDRRDKDRKSSKDKERSNGEVKSKKDRRDSKEKQAEKDKDTLSKVLQPAMKLGRIPKKSSDEKQKESPTVTPKKDKIDPKKTIEDRPRTVKIFNAKMRSAGLEEEVKPPPPRSKLKKPSNSTTSTATTSLPSIPQKRPSPVRDSLAPPPPEKKMKVEERPGSIKLIPPKPKPPVLQESDMFMDALTASASSKKEPKKRKRRLSVSKDSSSPPQSEAPPTPTSPTKTTITPPRFYQDTLETSEKTDEEDIGKNKEEEDVEDIRPEVVVSEEQKRNLESGLKSVLVHGKRSGPKKSIKWKPDENLVDVQYFELDETERVNVTKTFTDMARLEMSGEREALQMSRKLQNEDLMDAQTSWRFPVMIDLKEPLAIPGCKSLEKDIQFAREKNTLQSLYFDKRMLPDSPSEPDAELHQMTDPVLIPLDDPENSTETDLRGTPWPEPKGSPPPEPTPPNLNIFPNIPAPFAPNFPGMVPPPATFQFQPPPNAFIPPNVLPPAGDWNQQMMQPPPDMMFGQEQGFNPMMGAEGNFNPMHFNQQQNMFQPGGNYIRGRGTFRRGVGGPWVRMNGPGPVWNRGGGGVHRGAGRFCKNVKNHGYCRNRDSCPFIHPN